MQTPSCSVNGALVVLGAGFGMVRKFGGVVGRKWLLLLVLTCLPGLLFAQTPPPATYYVATTGSDTLNNGTSPSTPFATITKALTLCTGGQTVAVASGTYSTLTWTGTLSGIPTGTVVYDDKVRTSMVTVLGWGATPPLIQPPSTAAYMAVWINGGSYLTFTNFVMHSNNAWPLFTIAGNHATGLPHANFITIENCDLSDPDSANPNNETFCIGMRHGGDNITIQNCNIHDSSAGIGGDGPNGGGVAASNNVKILNNTLHGFSSDAIQFPDWNNVLIDGNLIENIYEVTGDTLHNDGIQFAGPAQNVTVSNNVIRHIGTGQGMLVQDTFGPIDNVLVENNLIYDNGDAAIQNSATHAVYLHNTSPSPLWLRAHYSGGAINDTVVANNNFYGTGIGYFSGSTAAYEDYNYTLSGFGHGTGAHDILGTDPTVNSAGGDYHPAPGSQLFAHAAQSFSATVDGTLTNFTAPTTDLDDITRGNPPTMGAYETTAGNSSIAYSGFDYSTTGAASGLTDGATDYGWVQSTWSAGTIVSPGLTYSTLQTVGLALTNPGNGSSNRTISPSTMPSGYTVVGPDGITRLGKAGTTIWLSGIIKPTSATNGTTCIRLDGYSVGGGEKLQIGEVNATTTSWGVGNGYSGLYAFATGAAPIQTGVPAFLVVEIQFTTGNSIINLWVNPPLSSTPPATPSATLSTVGVGPFNVLNFQGVRASTGDEFNVGTSWLSVISGGQ